MLPGPYGEAVARLDRSFLTTALVPTAVFATAYGAVAIASLWSFESAQAWWSTGGASVQLLATFVIAALLWFMAGLFASNWRQIVRLYEGYPFARAIWRRIRPDTRLNAGWYIPGIAYHRRRRNVMNLADRRLELYTRYPHDKYIADMLPTTVGNILLSGERYGQQRYGFDLPVLWPRLHSQLPDRVQVDLATFREQHQLPLALSFVAALFAVASGVTVVLGNGSPALFVASTGIGLVMAAVAYLLAIERAEEYAEQLRAVTDLFHSLLREEWNGPQHDSALADWYAAAKDFILTGKAPAPQVSTTRCSISGLFRSLVPTRAVARTHARRLEIPATPDAGPAMTVTVPAKMYRWVIARIRPLWLCVALGALVIAVGANMLAHQRVAVLVAATSTRPGALVAVEERSISRSEAPDSAVAADVSTGLVARTGLAVGEVLTDESVVVINDLIEVTLPSTGPRLASSDPGVVGAIVHPCGVILDDIIVSRVEDAALVTGGNVSMLLTRAQVQQLRGCAPDEVLLLVPGA
jgi:hypothetical protein